MSLVVPQSGLRSMLESFLSLDKALLLFGNDIQPAAGDAIDRYVEPQFKGYEPIILKPSLWTIDEKNPTTALYPAQTFIALDWQPPETVFGYLVIDRDSGVLQWAERFEPTTESPDVPYLIQASGQTIKIVPSFSVWGMPR
jgi:hypothetical protein